MGFTIPESPLRAEGYTSAFSADQILRDLASPGDFVAIEKRPEEVEVFHHSESVYKVEIVITKLEA